MASTSIKVGKSKGLMILAVSLSFMGMKGGLATLGM
jgi:hypothetical protein